MRSAWPLVLGIILVGVDGLVFVQELHAYRTAVTPGTRFPLWTLLTLVAAAAYLLGAGLAYDRARRRR